MHAFIGKPITDSEFCNLKPRNVFHKQLDKVALPCDEHRNRHILFRKKFFLKRIPNDAKIYISADDYYKLYMNGRFVAQGPAPSYHFCYNYNVVDVTDYLVAGENTIAVHTLYQGLINRVWVSGDNRHGLIFDLCVDGEVIACSDESVLTHPHSGYVEMGIAGYDTQFLEHYNSNSCEVGFENPDFDDSCWENAKYSKYSDHVWVEQTSKMLVFEKKLPVTQKLDENTLFLDFGATYVAYLCAKVRGKSGDIVTVRCGQELNDDGSVRHKLRAVCDYVETWELCDGISVLDQFDYKSFRYAELVLPEGCEVIEVYLNVRHHPFEINAEIIPEYVGNEDIKKIWNLCVNTQKYGVQEVIQDCMEREKGFYLGDGCYTSLTHAVLSGYDGMLRKLIDDAFKTDFITDGLVTCMDCAFMQEIAEYPLILVFSVLWHYKLTGDRDFLSVNYRNVIKLLDAYRRDYERSGLLRDLDKWCVVEWPQNFRHGYDVDITEGKVCTTAHVAINAYYIAAIKTANKIAEILGEIEYRNVSALYDTFVDTFYDKEKHLFKDSENTEHICLVGNTFPFAFGLCPDDGCVDNIVAMLRKNKISSLSMFCTFPILWGLLRYGREDVITEALLDEGAWLRTIREGGTTTYEGWGKESKWNTSLFHLTLSYAAIFISREGRAVLRD